LSPVLSRRDIAKLYLIIDYSNSNSMISNSYT
jgi:hypothetical protein